LERRLLDWNWLTLFQSPRSQSGETGIEKADVHFKVWIGKITLCLVYDWLKCRSCGCIS
jgi:hypothetical protein